LIASQISKLDNQSSWLARTGTLQETKLKTKFKLQLNYNKIMITTELIFNINFEPTLILYKEKGILKTPNHERILKKNDS
jgi:hypothetical protein